KEGQEGHQEEPGRGDPADADSADLITAHPISRTSRLLLRVAQAEREFFLAVRNGSDAAARKPSPGPPAGRGCACRSTVRCRRGRARRVAPCCRRRIACPWWGRCGVGSVRPCVRRAGL